ncbi:MAG: hypothetical protein MJ239_05970 [Bacilli bacterium]|nr:hypothetical protein [Bacilli bacterium]
MSRNDFILLILGIAIVLFVGGIFIALLVHYVKNRNELVKAGQKDEEIVKEYKEERTKKARALNVASRVFDLVLCALFLSMFAVSAYARIKGNDFPINNIGSVKVVVSESMSQKNEKNTYLFDNNLDNQFDMYDLVIVNALPQENELKLYDVVVYEKEGIEIIHRIVAIEEPNAFHPNDRWFTLKGDANTTPDVSPVVYSQMKAIYSSHKIPFVGVFVLWLQSSLGYLVLLVILLYLIAEPIALNSMRKVRDARIALIDGREFNPKTTPVLKILRDAFSLADENEKEIAKKQLLKYCEFLRLNEKQHEEKLFILAQFNAPELIKNGKIELFPASNKEIDKIDLGDNEFEFIDETRNKGVVKTKVKNKIKEQEVLCKHSFDSRLVYSSEDVQRNFAYFEDLLVAFGAKEETTWDKKTFKIGDLVLATFEIDDPHYEIEKEVEPVANEENVVSIPEPAPAADAGFGSGIRYDRSFTSKIIQSDDELKARYADIKNHLLSYEAKARMSWKRESFRKGWDTLAIMKVSGKTLNVYLALKPSDYEGTKYSFLDAGDAKQYESTPMRLKIRSDRAAKWAIELIDDMMANAGLTQIEGYEPESYDIPYEDDKALISQGLIKVYVDGVLQNDGVTTAIDGFGNEKEPEIQEEPVEEVSNEPQNEEIQVAPVNPFGSGIRYDRSFTSKIIQSENDTKARYALIKNRLLSYGIKARMSWKRESFRKGWDTLAIMKVSGKTLNVYLALKPSDYEGTKYSFLDAGDAKQYESTPMRLKIRSDRAAKWAIELIDDMMAEVGLLLIEGYQDENYDLPYEEDKDLISKGLIRVIVDGEAQNSRITSSIDSVIPNEEEESEVLEDMPEETPVQENANEEMSSNPFGSGTKNDRSFIARIIQSDDELKARYADIKNHLLSYEAKARMSWKRESFRKGWDTLAIMKVSGKTLNVYLALKPSDYEGTKYSFLDAGDAKQYESTPMRLKIRSDRAAKWAIELIDDMMANAGLTQIEGYEPESYDIPYEDDKALISQGLIKVYVDGVLQNDGVTTRTESVEESDEISEENE